MNDKVIGPEGMDHQQEKGQNENVMIGDSVGIFKIRLYSERLTNFFLTPLQWKLCTGYKIELCREPVLAALAFRYPELVIIGVCAFK